MCIPHAATGTKSNGFIKEDKPKKHIKIVSKDQFEKGDPDFIDERKLKSSTNKEESILDILFKKIKLI